MKGIGNRKQRIRISTYLKSCIMEYTVSDKLKFLFFPVLYSFVHSPSIGIHEKTLGNL